jgi:hypothetical protein
MFVDARPIFHVVTPKRHLHAVDLHSTKKTLAMRQSPRKTPSDETKKHKEKKKEEKKKKTTAEPVVNGEA